VADDGFSIGSSDGATHGDHEQGAPSNVTALNTMDANLPWSEFLSRINEHSLGRDFMSIFEQDNAICRCWVDSAC
jgi:hypothetical protein